MRGLIGLRNRCEMYTISKEVVYGLIEVDKALRNCNYSVVLIYKVFKEIDRILSFW